jgi:shikimate kinase
MRIPRDNVALIGMPGAGKSTLGVLFAKRTARGFLDTDLRIQEVERSPLQEIIERRGVDGFRQIEERCVTELDCSNYVIATGGSVVYSEAAMQHIGRIALRVYLDVPLADLARRLGDLDARGVIRAPRQDLEGLLSERRPLYERWADVRVDCDGLEHEEAVGAILAALAAD